ncbi:MAG: hypothetical protein ACR2II_11255 [Chthoniobacterales bacterium]
MTAWNEYLFAALALQDVEIFTLPLGLKMWDSTPPAGSSSPSRWSSFFLALSHYLISGLSFGAVKG